MNKWSIEWANEWECKWMNEWMSEKMDERVLVGSGSIVVFLFSEITN